MGDEKIMVKINTVLLKNMINQAVKVCSFIKMLPLTEIIEISIKNNILGVRATDNITHLLLTHQLDTDNQDMSVAVDAATINSLINKTTSSEVSLVINDSSLTFIGNGSYQLDIRVDESGQPIKFKDVVNPDVPKTAFNFDDFANKLDISKVSMPVGYDSPELNFYYVGDIIVATNAFKVTAVDNVEELKGHQMYVSRDLGKIIMDMNFKEANLCTVDDILYITGDGFLLSSQYITQLDTYPIDPVRAMLKGGYSSNVTVNKQDLARVLDRLSIFVSVYDNNSIKINFKDNRLVLSNEKNSSNEEIIYLANNLQDKDKDLNIKVNISNLKEQVSAIDLDNVVIYFDKDNDATIMMTDKDGSIVEVLSLSNWEE